MQVNETWTFQYFAHPRDDTPWAYRDMAAVGRRISRAYTASRRYLATHLER